MKMHVFGTLLGSIGLSYIAYTSLIREDAVYLLKLNILVPFVIITLSLSCLSYGVKQTAMTLRALVPLLTLNTPLTPQHVMTLNGLRHYAYIGSSIWIAYSAAMVFGFEQYSMKRFLSFAAIALLYALIFFRSAHINLYQKV